MNYGWSMASIRRSGTRQQIAKRLRRKRVATGLSAAATAKLLRVAYESWLRIEWGKASVPAERLLEVCEIIRATPLELLGVQQGPV